MQTLNSTNEIIKQVTCKVDDSQCCVLIFLYNARRNYSILEHSKLSYIQITIPYYNELLKNIKKCWFNVIIS